ncbi:MAG: hypothetical protein EOQ64_26245 [Mesorhizobium sp.]|nr:MAG: hypothetical protein EOQ64_26245 [Mesorhizobium sp.]
MCVNRENLFKTRSIMAISSGPMFPWDQSRCRLRSLSCLLAGCRGGFACAMLCWLEARLLQRRKPFTDSEWPMSHPK